MPLQLKPIQPYKFMLILIIALLLCAVSADAQAEEPSVKVIAPPCKDLKPFNNVDELLYQFYINLDSDCLFVMPKEELEEIWGIKILLFNPGEKNREKINEYYKLRGSADFYNKPYETERDSFYLEITPDLENLNSFTIHITNQYRIFNRTLFPDGNIPKLLPKAETHFNPHLVDPKTLDNWVKTMKNTPPENRLEESTLGPDYHFYSWYSSDRSRRISLTRSFGIKKINVLRSRLRR